MMHSINEIYTVYNGAEKIRYVTKEYLVANGIPTPKYKELRTMERVGLVYAHKVLSHCNNNKPVKVLDVDGVKLIYLYGEKTWFDTLEERDEYREEQAMIREKEKQLNKVKKAIIERLETMSLKQLNEVLASM